MQIVPSSSIEICAPVSSWIWLIILPFGPMTSPILSTGTVTLMTRGANSLISSGTSMASAITSRMCRRASRAWGSVTDLAALGGTDAAGLTSAVGREVVVVHVALARLRGERVEHLLHAQHVERGDTHDLGLAAFEDRRPVDAGQDLDLGAERADVCEATTVDTDLVTQDPLADELLLHRAVCRGDLLVAALELLREIALDSSLDLVDAVLAVLLVGNLERRGQVAGDGTFDGDVDIVLVVQEHRELLDRLGGRCGELGLGLAQHRDELLGSLKVLSDDRLGRGALALNR